MILHQMERVASVFLYLIFGQKLNTANIYKNGHNFLLLDFQKSRPLT